MRARSIVVSNGCAPFGCKPQQCCLLAGIGKAPKAGEQDDWRVRVHAKRKLLN